MRDKMTFQNLEKRVTECDLEQEYLELFGKLKTPTRAPNIVSKGDIALAANRVGYKGSYQFC